MITLHHLEKSRSHRIFWLLEELEVDYDVKIYQRNSKSLFAPDKLKEIHPLGKSPIITDGSKTLAESSAIIEYLLDTFPANNLRPNKDTDEYIHFRYFLHAAEGTFMPYLFLGFVMKRLTQPPVPLLIRPIAKVLEVGLRKQLITPNLKAQYEFIDKTLEKNEWFCGSQFSAADIQMSYPLLAANTRIGLDKYPNIVQFLQRIKARPAYQRAINKGGPVEL